MRKTFKILSWIDFIFIFLEMLFVNVQLIILLMNRDFYYLSRTAIGWMTLIFTDGAALSTMAISVLFIIQMFRKERYCPIPENHMRHLGVFAVITSALYFLVVTLVSKKLGFAPGTAEYYLLISPEFKALVTLAMFMLFDIICKEKKNVVFRY